MEATTAEASGSQMETAYNGRDSTPNRYLMFSNKTSSAKNGLRLVDPIDPLKYDSQG